MNDSTRFIEGIRPEVRGLAAYNAGLSAEYVKAHYKVSHVAKLGSNENPFGPSPRVLAAVNAAVPDIAQYPDPNSEALRKALAERLDADPAAMTFGNGSEDIIANLVRTFAGPGDEVLTMVPSFGLHILVPIAVGATSVTVNVDENYQLNMDKLIAAITPKTRVVMFSSPSNPVGTVISAADMDKLLGALRDDILFVFDEAYYEYGVADPAYPPYYEMLRAAKTPWMMLRTFSKAYGLAGMRVGYGVCSDPKLAQLIDRVRMVFNINRLAQAAALAALEDEKWMQRCVEQTIAERGRMKQAVEAMGYRVAPTHGNFIFFDTREDAAALAGRMLARGVVIKAWREPGYTTHARVSVGSVEDNNLFLAALKEFAQPG